jgi:hypothetical protein
VQWALRADPAQRLQGRLPREQLLKLMLCEVADRKVPRLRPRPRERRQLTRKQPHAGGLAGAVAPEQRDPVTGGEREVHVTENRA